MTVTMMRRRVLAMAAALVLAASTLHAGQAKVDVSGTWTFDVQTDAGAAGEQPDHVL